MDLYLRKSDEGQMGPEIYRVILKDDGDEVEIGSISVQHSAGAQHYWKWAIDTTHQTQGRGTDRKDCIPQFRAAWEKFSADPASLTEFLQAKRKLR